MDDLSTRLLPLVQEARGRCHACANQRTFDLPDEPVYHCRAYAKRMTAEERQERRDCPRWAPFRPADATGRATRAERNPLFADVINAEDQLFWHLKAHLDKIGVDLKSVLVVAQPSLMSIDDVSWVDRLSDRFGELDDYELVSFQEIVDELRALRYEQVCDLVEPLHQKLSDHDSCSLNPVTASDTTVWAQAK